MCICILYVYVYVYENSMCRHLCVYACHLRMYGLCVTCAHHYTYDDFISYHFQPCLDTYFSMWCIYVLWHVIFVLYAFTRISTTILIKHDLIKLLKSNKNDGGDPIYCFWCTTDMMYSISQDICTRFLLCCALLWLYIDWFSYIHQAYFTGTVAI